MSNILNFIKLRFFNMHKKFKYSKNILNSLNYNSELYDEDFYEGQPEKIILVACTPRSGSTLLWDGLCLFGAVPRSSELFGGGNMLEFFKRWGHLSQQEYLKRLFQFRTNKKGVFGVKAYHKQYRWFSDLLSIRDVQPIMIERKNKIAQAVSYAIGEYTNQWSSLEQVDREANESVYHYHLFRGYLQDIIDGTKFWCDCFKKNEINPKYIVYEDFIKNYEVTISSLVTWITETEVKPKQISPPRLQVQRNELNKRLQDRFILDLRAYGYDETEFETLLWPCHSGDNLNTQMKPKLMASWSKKLVRHLKSSYRRHIGND
jgi:LPS sulfotransferase NodH